MSRPVVYSASSVWTYTECSLRWWFQFVAVMPAEPNYEMATGIAVHAAAEKILRGKVSGIEIDEREAIAAYRFSMADTAWLPDEQGEALVRLFLTDVAPTTQPMLIEHPFQIEIDGIPYSGIFDWYDEAWTLWDLKTIKARPPKGSQRYWFNRVGYALGAREITGAVEADTGLAYLVKTKTPYYWPVLEGPVTDDDIDRFSSHLESVAESVERHVFEPDGLFKQNVCKTCPYALVCGPYQQFQETTS